MDKKLRLQLEYQAGLEDKSKSEIARKAIQKFLDEQTNLNI